MAPTLETPGTVPGWAHATEIPPFKTRALKVYLGTPGRLWATRAHVVYEAHPQPLDGLGRALFKRQARAQGRRVLFKPLGPVGAQGPRHFAAWATAPICGRATHPSVAGCAILARSNRGLCGPCGHALGVSP